MSKRSLSGSLWGCGVALLALALVQGCGAQSNSGALGGETHFLDQCTTQCGGGFDCIQGVCTQGCILGESSCSSLPGAARCTDQSVEPGMVAVCDVACSGSEDCSALSERHRCQGGFCRADGVGVPKEDDPADAGTQNTGGAGGFGGEQDDPAAGGTRAIGGAGAGGAMNGEGGSAVGGMSNGVVDAGAPACGCVEETVTWELNGGFRLGQVLNVLQPCSTYNRDEVLIDGIGGTCSAELTPCESTTSAGAVAEALSSEVVRSAFDQAPILFGADSRPVDGVVLRINQGGKMVEVGSPCAMGPSCEPIPPEIQALADLLRQIEAEQLAQPPCSEVFGTGP